MNNRFAAHQERFAGITEAGNIASLPDRSTPVSMTGLCSKNASGSFGLDEISLRRRFPLASTFPRGKKLRN
jgi:hypothetical protein